jgi:hypothetical protein
MPGASCPHTAAVRTGNTTPLAAGAGAFIAFSSIPQTLPRNCTCTPAVWQARRTEMFDPAVLPR